MKENKLVDLSMDFAIKIIKLCETIKGHYSLVNQLERSANGALVLRWGLPRQSVDWLAMTDERQPDKLELCIKKEAA